MYKTESKLMVHGCYCSELYITFYKTIKCCSSCSKINDFHGVNHKKMASL